MKRETVRTVMTLFLILFQFVANTSAQEKDESVQGGKTDIMPTEEVLVPGPPRESTVSVITSTDIETAQPVALDQLLKTVPGIDVQGAGEYGDKVTLNIRGLQGRYGAQRTLVLIDGRPVNEEYLGDFDFRFVPVEAIERVEISKGPASALYGGLAFGGVINIVTKDPRKEKEQNVKSSLGSYNSRRSEAVVSTGAETLPTLLTGHLFATDGYIKNSDGSNRDWEDGQFFAKVVKGVGQESLLTFSTGAGYGTGDEEDFKFHQVSNFQHLLFETPSGKGSKSKLQLRLYRNSTFRELGRDLVGDGRYQQYTAGAQTQWTYNLNKANTLTCGLEAKSQAANVREVARQVKEEITESACYVQEEIAAGIFKFALGVRADTNEEFGTEVSPRVGATCEPMEKTVLRLSCGKAFRPPAISDLFMPPTPYMGMTFECNPDLKPETLYSAEVGLRQETQLAGKKIYCDVALYHTRDKNFWDYMLVSWPTLKPMNVDVVSIFGAELEMATALSPRLRAKLGYSYTDARYQRYKPDPTIEHNQVEDIPQHSSSAALIYLTPEGHTGSVTVRIVSDRYTDAQNDIGTKLHSFAVLGLGGTAKLSENARAFARIDNALDKKYREVATQVAPGLALTIGLSITF